MNVRRASKITELETRNYWPISQIPKRHKYIAYVFGEHKSLNIEVLLLSDMGKHFEEDKAHLNFFQKFLRHSRHSSEHSTTVKSFRHRFKSTNTAKEFHTIRRWKNKALETSTRQSYLTDKEVSVKDIRWPELRTISGKSGEIFDRDDSNQVLENHLQFDYREEPSFDESVYQCGDVRDFEALLTSGFENVRHNLSKKVCSNLSRAALKFNIGDGERYEDPPSMSDSACKSNATTLETDMTSADRGIQGMNHLDISLVSLCNLGGSSYTSGLHAADVKQLFSPPSLNAYMDNGISMSSFSHIPTIQPNSKDYEPSPYGKHAKYFI